MRVNIRGSGGNGTTFREKLNLTSRALFTKLQYWMQFEVLTAVVMKSSDFGIRLRVVRWKTTNVSEKHVASIFRVEE
jgi:hypothetical protein